MSLTTEAEDVKTASPAVVAVTGTAQSDFTTLAGFPSPTMGTTLCSSLTSWASAWEASRRAPSVSEDCEVMAITGALEPPATLAADGDNTPLLCESCPCWWSTLVKS
jgi:hypothetical protein